MKKNHIHALLTTVAMMTSTASLATGDLVQDAPFDGGQGEASVTAVSENNTNLVTLTSAPEIDPATGSPKIALMLNDEINPIIWQNTSSRLRSQKEVTQLYARLYYRILWTENGVITPLAAEVIEATRNSYQHALRPEVYHTKTTASLQAGQKVDDADEFDVILTDAFITLKKHLANGVMNPKSQFETWNTKPETIDYFSVYLKVMQSGSLGNALSITDSNYNILQQSYLNELNKKRDLELQPLIISEKKLTMGSKGQSVRILRQRLGLSDESDVYDKEVKNAVKEFQLSKLLQADGVAGRNTIRILNQHGADHREVLAINLERHRWGNTPQNRNYIWVNIPSFTMAVKNNQQWLFESRTVVGRYKRQTPVFSDVLESVVLAPYWNVPKTIFKKDKLPKLRNNPNAFGRGMQVVDNNTGKVVSADSVDWSEGGEGYRLRQSPGARNALGRVKFLFPNKHAIYMHDTPSKNLFKKDRRAYSSGCVRLQRAEDFAVFLLEDMGYDRSRIKKESRRSREKWVSLKDSKNYPVFINYFTAWVDSAQQVQYSGDIYRKDKKMSKDYQQVLSAL